MSNSENPYASPAVVDDSPKELTTVDEKEARRSQILGRLQLPALGIVFTSTLGVALFAWFLGLIFFTRQPNLVQKPDEWNYPPDYSDQLSRYCLLLFYLLISLPIAFFGSLSMIHGRHRPLAMAACMLSIIPCAAPGFPLSVPFALVALFRLRQPEVIQAMMQPRIGTLSNRHWRIDQLFWPSTALLFLTTLMLIWMASPWIAALLFNYWGRPVMLELQLAMFARPLSASWLIISYASMLIVFLASIQMLRGKSYALCLTGASLALVPILSPFFVIGIPFGIWALVILLRKDTRAAFADVKSST